MSISLATNGYYGGDGSGGGIAGEVGLANPNPAAGTDLSTDRDTARYTPVSFNVYAFGLPVTSFTAPWAICIKFANDDRPVVAYDSTVGFMPPFEHLSTWQASSATLTLLPDGGWQDTIVSLYVAGQGDTSVFPIRSGAAGSDRPPNAP